MELDFNRFTDISRQTITQAYKIAREEQLQYIVPQVLMVAVMQEGRDMVYNVLQKLNVNKTAFFQSVGESLDSIPKTGDGHPDLSEELKEILADAQNKAEQTGNQVVALDHIFWALGTADGEVKEVMTYYGITDEELENAILYYSHGGMAYAGVSTSTIDEDGIVTLNQFARNLNQEADNRKIEPVIGRDVEIRRILQVLTRKTKNNPVLVGPPGTGKTAIIEGLTCRIRRGDVPNELKCLQIYSLDIAALSAGASYAGSFEERLKHIIEEVKVHEQIVLFVDEIHLLMDSSRSMNAANILKPAMARGEIKLIGATTTDEYCKYIEKDKAFERRFQRIDVTEPDCDSAITILRGIKKRFEQHHRIKILDEALVAAVKLSARYINDRCLPDKAIDIIDEAASKMRLQRSSVPNELDDLNRTIRNKEMERESLKQDDRSHDLTELEREIANLREQENILNAKWQNEYRDLYEFQRQQDMLEIATLNYDHFVILGKYDEALKAKKQVDQYKKSIRETTEARGTGKDSLIKFALDEDDVRAVITEWTGIPVTKMDDDETTKLINLEQTLHQAVIGQEDAVHIVSEVIRRNRMGFGDPNRPIGSFLFLGTTGVGKTELAKALAEYLFDSPNMMVRIDMSEYQQEFAVTRLFGAPPGYVGYDEGGQLTEAVRRNPYSVVLLDEVEKAHSKVFETLLQVLDDGRMTDGKGNVINFKNTIIIMTSNLGADTITECICEDGTIGHHEEILRSIIAMLKQRTSPEFVNRIDEVVLFKPLTFEDIRNIVCLQMNKQQKKLAKSGIELVYSQEVIDEITRQGFDPTMGARPIKRAINNVLINPLTEALLLRKVSKNNIISVLVKDGVIDFENC